MNSINKMSNNIVKPSEESTFKSYTPALAKAYAAGRGSYHEDLVKIILDHHESNGGTTQVLLDVGCGPGNSTRPLARHFDSAFGIDPSVEMIKAAKNLSAESPEETASDKSISFFVGRAEDLIGSIPNLEHGVDLLTSGMAVCVLCTKHGPFNVLISSRLIGSTCHVSGLLLLLASSRVAP